MHRAPSLQCSTTTRCSDCRHLVQGWQQLPVFGAATFCLLPTLLLPCAQSLLALGWAGKLSPHFPGPPLGCAKPSSCCQHKDWLVATMSLSPSGPGPIPTLPRPCETQAVTASSPVWCRAPLCSSGLAAQTLGRTSLRLLQPHLPWQAMVSRTMGM